MELLKVKRSKTTCLCNNDITYDSLFVQGEIDKNGLEFSRIHFDCPDCKIEVEINEQGEVYDEELINIVNQYLTARSAHYEVKNYEVV